MSSGKNAPASTERMDNRYSAIRACLFLQDETGSDVAAGIPHGFNLVPTWDEVADARYCGAGLWRWQNNRTAFYPINGTDAADFTDGGRGKIALTLAVELSFLKKGGTGTAADIIFSDGKYGRDIAVERMKNLFAVLKNELKNKCFYLEWGRFRMPLSIFKGGYMPMAKTIIRPKIEVQPVYLGGRDMREVFISLLVNEVRRGKSSPRTFEIIKDTEYNGDRK